MLKIYTPKTELFNEQTCEFVYIPSTELVLEHSLISLTKWESKWKKSFLNVKELTNEELIDYIRCMTVGKEADELVYKNLGNANLRKIQKYIDDPMTATTIKDAKNHVHRNEIITSEIIYYWMIEHGIPFECEKWHLNRLLTLIRVCNVKGSSGKKMSKSEIFKQNAELNAARRKSMHSKG